MGAAESFFHAQFGRSPEAHGDAPGRINLIGEHTDYSGGFVLPMAIPQRTYVAIARRVDNIARVVSASVHDAPITFTIGSEVRLGNWVDYVQGTVQALRASGFSISGFDASITSDVPIGSGLSSSAALEVALIRALRNAFGLSIDDIAIARVGQRAENDFVGAPVGIMDPMASSMADDHTALFLDTRTLTFDRVALPQSMELLVIDSGIAHSHAAGEYRTRRSECDRAATLLGIHELRDLTDIGLATSLPPPLHKRVRHVFAENARVLEAVACMRRGDVVRLGELFDQSHASLRDDFEVSVPDVDRLVMIARRHPHVFGARMTGGGFGGAIVVLVANGHSERIGSQIRAAYDASGTPRAHVLVPRSQARL